MLTLFQAEWCPYSARVRQTLTEYGVDFVARQVPAEKRDRDEMRAETGTDAIPLMILDDGRRIEAWQEMIDYLRSTFPPPPDADRRRQKWFEEAPLRDPGHVLT